MEKETAGRRDQFSGAPLGRSPGVSVLLGHWLLVSKWEEAGGASGSRRQQTPGKERLPWIPPRAGSDS